MIKFLIHFVSVKQLPLVFMCWCVCSTDCALHAQSTEQSLPVITDLGCDQDVFYTVGPNGAVKRFRLSGGVVTFDTLLTTYSALNSLAIGQNLAGGIPDPTFYGATTGNQEPTFYNNSSWNIPPPGSPTNLQLLNNGAYGPYNYYSQSGSPYCESVWKYDGMLFTQFFTFPSPTQVISMADVGVDANGNLYVLGGNGFTSDTLYVVAPSGQIIQRAPLVINTAGAYGGMVIHGLFHIGFSGSNALYPNSLLPITMNGNVATLGAPIPFQNQSFVDLASCDPGSALFSSNYSESETWSVYPNPTSDQITVEANNANWEIIDVNGAIVLSGVVQVRTTIETSGLAPGVYLLHLLSSSGIDEKRLVIIR